MSEEKKQNYLDVIRGEFGQMATERGVEPEVAGFLADYLVQKMLNSWKNGLKAGQKGVGQRVAQAA